MTRPREVFWRLLLLGLSIVGTVALAEIGVRVFLALAGPRIADPEAALRLSESSSLAAADSPISLRGLVRASAVPDIVYELKPGLRGTYLGQPLQTSSRGLRDREYPLAKPEDVFRIVGLGDSVMFGWGVAQDEPFLEVLERRLAVEGDPAVGYEVLNFAVPGYNTAMEVATFEHRALAYEPDLVIVSFVQNDFKLPHFMQKPPELLSLRRWYLKDLVTTRLRLLASYRERRLMPHDLRAFAPADRARARDQYRHMEGPEGFRKAVSRLAELTRERSIPVIIDVPMSEEEPWATARRVADESGFHIVDAGPYYLAYMAEHGVENTRRGWSETLWISDRDHHPNAAAHRLHAEALLDQLRRMGIVPAESSAQ